MINKPRYFDEYPPELTILVRKALLHLSTKIGDFLDEIVLVGGLVPVLLIPNESLLEGEIQHPGTTDLDIGLDIALFEGHQYDALAERLLRAGFKPDVNEQGNLTRQRWILYQAQALKVTVDFLIQPSFTYDKGGDLRDLTRELAAIITPGLNLAFRDYEAIALKGTTFNGAEAQRTFMICGPGAFLVLKALAFRNRGEGKDAFDLFYVVRNYGRDIDDLLNRLRPLLDDPNTHRAIEILRQDFLNIKGTGPIAVAEFLSKGPDEEIQADVVGFIYKLLSKGGLA